MTLPESVKIAKKKYSFAKNLNYAYSVGPLFCLVFSKEPLSGELLGGSMIIVNKNTKKSEILPIRPQIMDALRQKGTLTKVFSVQNRM